METIGQGVCVAPKWRVEEVVTRGGRLAFEFGKRAVAKLFGNHGIQMSSYTNVMVMIRIMVMMMMYALRTM